MTQEPITIDQYILQFTIEFRAAILGGGDSARMCAAISGPLCAALTVQGVSCRLLESDLGECNHVFIQLNDGQVLDPTADQFNSRSQDSLPEVYLGQKTWIHEGVSCTDFEQIWLPLLQEFKRLEPNYRGESAGQMVREVLMSLQKDATQMSVKPKALNSSLKFQSVVNP